LASLILSERPADLVAAVRGEWIDTLAFALRPYGGTLCLPSALLHDAQFTAPPTYGELAVERNGDQTLISRRGPLPGAAAWTHADADSGNTNASDDRFITTPVGLLWFDASMRWHRKPGSAEVRVAGGRLFVKAGELHAADVFTGRKLWSSTLPFAHRPTDQLIATEEAVYVTGGKDCLVLDPATGRETRRMHLPDDLAAPWLNLRLWEDCLVGSSGRSLLCVDRHDGSVVWRYPCDRDKLSIAVGGGRVFCAELVDSRRGGADAEKTRMRCFDITNGDVVWESPGGSNLWYSEKHDLLVTPSAIILAKDGKRIAGLPGPPTAAPRNVPQPLALIDEMILWGTLEKFVLRDLSTGEESGDATGWVRRGCTDLRASPNLVTTRFRANAACINLASRDITSLWNIRPGCNNNLFPADGVLNIPNLTGGCTCNYTPNSQAYVPLSVIQRSAAGR
jgi:hypothetical protein